MPATFSLITDSKSFEYIITKFDVFQVDSATVHFVLRKKNLVKVTIIFVLFSRCPKLIL